MTLIIDIATIDRQQIKMNQWIASEIKEQRDRKIEPKMAHLRNLLEKTRHFSTMQAYLRNDDTKFFNFFRMSIPSFDELHGRLKDTIQRKNTKMRNCIQPLEMLAITLRVGISTARVIVKDVCQALWNVLQSECLPHPTKEMGESVASGFEQTANFPHCIGAVDGKHVRLVNPIESGSMYYNYKDYYSIALMGIADSKYRFVFVHIGSYGKDCDSSIFKETQLWKSIESSSKNLPGYSNSSFLIDGSAGRE
ncbi:unnamed protein product [Larinioides sclopetarius]|uniref:DDE Tnp4 domain-containing protein n=1 Tax=Larinioides sclopetarius TaxID=280406 RepID=A0AAV2BV96_9ARAC